jgi:hypothetical protein
MRGGSRSRSGLVRLLGVDVGGVDLRGPIEAFARAPRGAVAAGEACLLEVNVLPGCICTRCRRGAARPVFEAFVAYCLQLPGTPEPCARVGV